MMKLIFLGAVAALTLTACSSNASTPAPASSAPAPASSASATPSASPHLALGDTADISDEYGKATVTVTDPKIINPVEFWGPNKIVIATVLVNATQGEVPYTETAFELVLPDGTHVQAGTVASDTGLPGRSLGSGNLSAPEKVKGLITFTDTGLTSLAGTKIKYLDPRFHWDWSVQ